MFVKDPIFECEANSSFMRPHGLITIIRERHSYEFGAAAPPQISKTGYDVCSISYKVIGTLIK